MKFISSHQFGENSCFVFFVGTESDITKFLKIYRTGAQERNPHQIKKVFIRSINIFFQIHFVRKADSEWKFE